MKKIILYIVLAMSLPGLSSCTQEKAYAAWACPMQCQADTVYTGEGKCPVCKMDLEGLDTIDSLNTIILKNNN